MAVGDDDLGGERALRPAGQRGKHLPGLIAIVVDRLLAEDDETRLLRRDHALQQFGDRERLDEALGLDQNAPIGAHRERCAQGFGYLSRANGDDDDFAGLARFLLAQRFLDRDLVEWVHRHLDVGELDAGTVGPDAYPDIVIDHPFHGHENFHFGLNSDRPRAPISRAIAGLNP